MRTGADIINRIDEQQHLLTLLSSSGTQKQTLVLQSPPGFGKSHLVDQVVSYLEAESYYLVIGRSTHYDGATYIQQLAAALNDCAKRTGGFPSFAQFRQTLQAKEPDESLALIEGAIKPVGEVITGAATVGTVGTALKVMHGFLSSFAAGSTPEDDVFLGSNSDAIKLCERYARFAVGRTRLILRVNDYTAIGEESDFYLRTLYSNAPNLTLILEVTERAGEPDDVEMRVAVSDRFPGGSIHYRKLDRVSTQHVVDYYRQTSGTGSLDLARQARDAFASSGGNFRRFKFLLEDKIKRQSTLSASTEERVIALVQDMPLNGKRLLALVTVAPMALRPDFLKAIWDTNRWTEARDLSSTLNLLRGDLGTLISLENDVLALAGEFMRGYLNRCPTLAMFRIEARRVLLAQLRQESLSAKSNDRTYSNLLAIIALMIEGRGSGDSSLLPASLEALDLGHYPPNKIELARSVKSLFRGYVYPGRQASGDPGTRLDYDRVYEEICKILYRIGDIDTLMEVSDAYTDFLPLEGHSAPLRLSIISARITSSRRESLSDIESITREDPFLYVGSRLLLVKYYRTFGLLKKAKREWRRLRHGGEVGKTRFEGVLYEYGALLYPINLIYRLRCLARAKAYHLASNNPFHAVSASLGIAGTYLHIPLLRRSKLRWAERELSTIKHLLAGVRIMDHILENNTAIAELLEDDTQSGPLEKLMYAYDRCGLKADKLLIGANLIECFIRLRKLGLEAPSIAVYVKETLRICRHYQNSRSEFVLYALSSCYRYFVFMDDRQAADEVNRLDLTNMPIHLLFVNAGSPRTALAKLFVRWIYSRLYLAYWPKVQPVFNWAIDFYSFQWHYPRGAG
jgi:hypothetical protein